MQGGAIKVLRMHLPGSSESDATSTNVSAKAVNPINSTRVQFIVFVVAGVFCDLRKQWMGVRE